MGFNYETLKVFAVFCVLSQVNCAVIQGTDDVDSSNASLVTGSGVVIGPVTEESEILLLGGDDVQVNGGPGDDKFELGDGDDSQIYAGAGSDSILGGDGNDVKIHGGSDIDFILGEGGNDELFGDSGDDTISGGLGNDLLNGGSGEDKFVFGLSDGFDSIVDFNASVDLIVYPEKVGLEEVSVSLDGSDTVIGIDETKVRIVGQQLRKEDISFVESPSDDDKESPYEFVRLIGPIVGGVLVVVFTVWRYVSPNTMPCRRSGGPESRVSTV